MGWLLNLVHKVCLSLKNSHDVHALLDAIPELYKDLTVDLQEVPDAGEKIIDICCFPITSQKVEEKPPVKTLKRIHQLVKAMCPFHPS